MEEENHQERRLIWFEAEYCVDVKLKPRTGVTCNEAKPGNEMQWLEAGKWYVVS